MEQGGEGRGWKWEERGGRARGVLTHTTSSRSPSSLPIRVSCFSDVQQSLLHASTLVGHSPEAHNC